MKNAECVGWINLSQNNKWQALLNTAVRLQVPQNAANIWSAEQRITSQEGICSTELRGFSKLRSGFSWFRTRYISRLLWVCNTLTWEVWHTIVSQKHLPNYNNNEGCSSGPWWSSMHFYLVHSRTN